MFLRRVTITGFKSFASRTVLELTPGLTAVVGPNGSGKSNFAEAIRWAFGEQSRSRLRLDSAADVVFAGTVNRPRASYAEVTLVFDNTSGAFPLELTEIEITRRLYRSGESNYLLAGRPVRQSDIQSLLSQAGLGVDTYAIIGQGTIDQLLLSSPAERKLLFEEAAGIRAPDQRRADAVKKLEQTNANLARLAEIVAEIEPRLETLKRAEAATSAVKEFATKRLQLSADLEYAKLRVLTRAHKQLEEDHAGARLAGTEADAAFARAAAALEAADSAGAQLAAQKGQLLSRIAGLEQARDAKAQLLADARSAREAASQAKSGLATSRAALKLAETAIAEVQARRLELEAEIKRSAEAQSRAQAAVDRAAAAVQAAQAQLVAMRHDSDTGTRDQYVLHALDVIKLLATSLDTAEPSYEEIRLMVHKAGRLLSHAKDAAGGKMLQSLAAAQKQLETALAKRETAIEHQTNITIAGRALEIDRTYLESEMGRLADQLAKVQADAVDEAQIMQQESASVEALQLAEVALAEATTGLESARLDAAQLSDPTAADRAQLAVIHERATRAAQMAEATINELTSTLEAAASQRADQEAAVTGLTPSDQADREPQDLLAELKTLEATLDAHASLGLDSGDEFAEVSTRHADLTSQIADLTTAKADLEQIIGRLEQIIKDRFHENFDRMSTHFSDYFATLFGGGTAAMLLAQTDGGEFGIEIKASPKGKRALPIGALSGGEKALAGIALLAAILRVSPSPFIVLDEVDAALDEANSARVADVLEGLATTSQLVVITHNRQTMKAASVIYGITTGDSHVSQILSMRLEEAGKMAAR